MRQLDERMHYEQVLTELAEDPTSHGLDGSFRSAVAYVTGLGKQDPVLLRLFRLWLQIWADRTGQGQSLTWLQLVLAVFIDDVPQDQLSVEHLALEDDEDAARWLLQSLAQCCREREDLAEVHERRMRWEREDRQAEEARRRRQVEMLGEHGEKLRQVYPVAVELGAQLRTATQLMTVYELYSPEHPPVPATDPAAARSDPPERIKHAWARLQQAVREALDAEEAEHQAEGPGGAAGRPPTLGRFGFEQSIGLLGAVRRLLDDPAAHSITTGHAQQYEVLVAAALGELRPRPEAADTLPKQEGQGPPV